MEVKQPCSLRRVCVCVCCLPGTLVHSTLFLLDREETHPEISEAGGREPHTGRSQWKQPSLTHLQPLQDRFSIPAKASSRCLRRWRQATAQSARSHWTKSKFETRRTEPRQQELIRCSA
eukprot:3142758-Rhodomonas_salina.1